MHSAVEVSYIDGTHSKYNVKERASYSIDTMEGIRTLTIFTVEGIQIEANWDQVKSVGFHPAPVAASKNKASELPLDGSLE